MSQLDELIAKARATGLDTLADLIGEFGKRDVFVPFAAPDAKMVAPPATGLTDLLEQLMRRGLEPDLVAELLKQFDGRPLEQGLLAWDVLTGSIWPQEEDDIFGELQAAAKHLKEVLPDPGERCIDLNKHPANTLVEKFAARSGSTDQLLELAKRHDLGAIDKLRHETGKVGELFAATNTQQSIRSLARLLHLAHLPTLAAVYLHYLVRTLGYRPAGADLCEVMFDAGAAERLPEDAIKKGDFTGEEMDDFAQYCVYRAHIATKNTVDAYAILQTAQQKRPGGWREKVVQASLALQFGDPAPSLAALDEICAKNELWRYAWRVRVAVAASQSPPDSQRPVELADEFVRRFGNDFRCYYDALQAAPQNGTWQPSLCKILAREASQLPHEWNAWKSIASIVGDEDSIPMAINEIDDHLGDQSELD